MRRGDVGIGWLLPRGIIKQPNKNCTVTATDGRGSAVGASEHRMNCLAVDGFTSASLAKVKESCYSLQKR